MQEQAGDQQVARPADHAGQRSLGDRVELGGRRQRSGLVRLVLFLGRRVRARVARRTDHAHAVRRNVEACHGIARRLGSGDRLGCACGRLACAVVGSDPAVCSAGPGLARRARDSIRQVFPGRPRHARTGRVSRDIEARDQVTPRGLVAADLAVDVSWSAHPPSVPACWFAACPVVDSRPTWLCIRTNSRLPANIASASLSSVAT